MATNTPIHGQKEEKRFCNQDFIGECVAGIRAVLTVLIGAPISNTNSSFGNKLVYLKPLIDQFIRDSKAESLFAPTLASYDRKAQDFVITNPRPTDWKSRLIYEDVVKFLMNGKYVNVYGYPDYKSLKEKKDMPTSIGNYYTIMFTYMAMDIFHNNQEMTKRIMKMRLYSMVWNELSGGKEIPKSQQKTNLQATKNEGYHVSLQKRCQVIKTRYGCSFYDTC
jgi:hypothetical protein